MSKIKQDKTPWLLIGSIALTLSGVSILVPYTPALAQSPRVELTGAATTPRPFVADGDGDGDELLEHWGDPQYAREQRGQLAGLFVFLGGAVALSLRRQATLRRRYRHG